MEPVHRLDERFFIDIDVSRIGHCSAHRTEFDKFLIYVHVLREKKPYGFTLKVGSDVRTVPYGATNEEVDNLLTYWWTNLSNYPLFSTLIDSFIFFNEYNVRIGKLYYWNWEVGNINTLKTYFIHTKKNIEYSSIFSLEIFNLARDLYFKLNKIIEDAITPSFNNPFVSKFECGNSEYKHEFKKLIKDTEIVLRKMEEAITEIEKRKEEWKFIKAPKTSYIILKDVYKLATSKFTY